MLLHSTSVPTHGFESSTHSYHSHRRRRALINLSTSGTPIPRSSLGLSANLPSSVPIGVIISFQKKNCYMHIEPDVFCFFTFFEFSTLKLADNLIVYSDCALHLGYNLLGDGNWLTTYVS